MVNYNLINQELYQEINKVRKNPQSYISHLENMTKYFKGSIYRDPNTRVNLRTKEGVSAVIEAINYLKNSKSKKNYNKNLNLEKAAKELSNYIGTKGLMGHQGGNMSMQNRTKKYLNKIGAMAENISFGNDNARDIIVQLIVDDGVRGRGHRENIFSESYTDVGISSGYHNGFDHCAVFNFFGDTGMGNFSRNDNKFGNFKRNDNNFENFYGNQDKFGNQFKNTNMEIKKIDLFKKEKDNFGFDKGFNTDKNFGNLNRNNDFGNLNRNNNFGNFGRMDNFGNLNRNKDFGNFGNSHSKYQIPKSEWPEDYVSMSKNISSQTINGKKTTVVIINFVLSNGKNIQRKKEFNY